MKLGGFLGIIVVILLIGIASYFIYNSRQPMVVNDIQSTNLGNSETSAGSESTNPGNTAKNYDIAISGFAFSPPTLSIKVGDSITWTNFDSATHTVTSDKGEELNSGPITKGLVYTHRFNVAGTYAYHCDIHTSMKGQITVS